MSFYRQKVDITQAHRLTADTLRVATRYLQFDRADAATAAPLFLGSRKNGVLGGSFGERSMQERVAVLGQLIGVPGLSPHDGRHFWATAAARVGTELTVLRDAGGWASFARPSRYIERARLANEGVRLKRRAQEADEL